MSTEPKRATLKPFAAVERRPVRVTPDALVRAEPLDAQHACPLVVQPAMAGVRLAAWAEKNRDWIESSLLKAGALLFRGFDLRDQADFEAFLDGIALERMHYMEGATPRKKLSEHVYTSTEFPATHSIALHNELSYVRTWPMKVAFFCVVPAAEGGATPIADVREVYRRIPPEVLQPFVERGWMLVRNFGDGLSLTWQDAYRMSDRQELEAYAAEARITLEWKSETRLRTRQVRPCVASHPKTGDLVWFNHVAFWHVSSLDPATRQVLVGDFGEDGIPYNTYYGDGTPIDDSVIEELRRAYDAATITFPWRQGDLILVDNMLVAHGRQPFKGPRKIIVSMGQPHTRD